MQGDFCMTLGKTLLVTQITIIYTMFFPLSILIGPLQNVLIF